MLALAVFTAYLLRHQDNKITSLITAIPCCFMGAVTLSYIVMADEGLRLGASIAYPAGIIFAIALAVFYVIMLRRAINIQKGKIKPRDKWDVCKS